MELLTNTVDWGRPVNWNHPLNRGLVSWWLAVPGRQGFGSNVWRDLCRRNDGTLTNMDPATDWVGGERFAVDFRDDTDAYVSGPQTGLPVAPVTLAAWIYPKTLGGTNNGRIVSKRNSAIQYEWLLGQVSHLQFQGLDSTSNVTLNQWQRVVSTYDGTTVTHFINGIGAGSGAKTLTIAEDTSADLRIGNLQIASRNFDGLIDDVRIASRIWTPADAAMDYDLSRRNYPGLLNRIRTPRLSVQEAAAGFIDNTNPIYRHVLALKEIE